MSKVYTKAGDTGETGLVGGKRVSKADHRIDLYGEVDELNSRVGMAVSYLSLESTFAVEITFLRIIQSALFDLGSNLACELEDRAKFNLPGLSADLVQQMEAAIDVMQESLPVLKNFILPGGSPASASLHLCRTGARNVERKMIAYLAETREEMPPHSLEFMNRLSDYFFVLARFVTKVQGSPEILWKSRS